MGNELPALNSQDERNQPDKPKESKPLQASVDINSLFLTGLFILGLFYTLYFAQAVFLPLVLALMLSFLLAPIVRGLKRIKVPETVGAALLLLILLGTVFMGFTSSPNLLQS